jgi:iduronate 2-sulfatase
MLWLGVQLFLLFIGVVVAGAREEKRLNVLLIVVDDLRPEFNVSYGQTHLVTPVLDTFAKDSLTFNRAYTQYAHCSPSRNSFLSGRSPQSTGVYNFIDDFRHPPSGDGSTIVSLPEHFKKHGYWTVGGGKVFHPGRPANNDMPKSWTEYTFPNGDDPGCRANETIYSGVCPTQEPDDWFYDNQLAQNVVQNMQKAKQKGMPFFLAAGIRRPHRPWDVPDRFYNLYKKENIPLAKHTKGPTGMPELAYIQNSWPPVHYNQSNPVSDDIDRLARLGYYASVSFTDYNIGILLDGLDRYNFTSNTVVAIVSDHGWHLGEQGEYCKRTNFELAVRVPILIRSPKHVQTFGKRTDSLFELLDLYKTLNALSGAADRVQTGVEGEDLSELFKNFDAKSKARAFAFSQMARCPQPNTLGPDSACNQVKRSDIAYMGFSVRNARWRFTVWLEFVGEKNRAVWPDSLGKVHGQELYDHKDDDGTNYDRFELDNIASEYPGVCSSLYSVLRNEFA